jgi:hypothetical protein
METVNETLTSTGEFGISGHTIKAVGDKPEVGEYLVSAADAGRRVKVSGRLAENTTTKLIGVIPTPSAGQRKAEIKARFASGRIMGERSVFTKAFKERAVELARNTNRKRACPRPRH